MNGYERNIQADATIRKPNGGMFLRESTDTLHMGKIVTWVSSYTTGVWRRLSASDSFSVGEITAGFSGFVKACTLLSYLVLRRESDSHRNLCRPAWRVHRIREMKICYVLAERVREIAPFC